ARQLLDAVHHRFRPPALSVARVRPDHEANETLSKHTTTLPSRPIPYVMAENKPRCNSRSLTRHWMEELIWTRHRLAHAKLVVRDHHPTAETLLRSHNGRRWSISRSWLIERLGPGSDLVIILDVSRELAPTLLPSAPQEDRDVG